LGCPSDLTEDPADWPLAAHSAPALAPAVRPASAAACFRNRLRPEPFDSMIASRDPEFSDFELALAQGLANTTL
jgi:hypothetical protein